MNKKKWKNPNVPIEILALKLAEEVGEVSREITDAPGGKLSKLRLAEELGHVIFIASTLRDRISP